MHGNVQVSVRRGGVGVPEQSGPGLLPDLFRRFNTDRPAGETICAYGHFFVDREHASAWPDLHPEAVLLSVEDAVHLAHEIANAARRYAEKTQI